ncbi:hypothetical protein R6Q57_001592 [Mikania cordata]
MHPPVVFLFLNDFYKEASYHKDGKWISNILLNQQINLQNGYYQNGDLRSNTEGSSDHHHENVGPVIEAVKKRKWAIPDDESDNWSNDVLEFYHNGDSTYCYSPSQVKNLANNFGVLCSDTAASDIYFQM